MTDTIIEVENLGKRYVLDHQQEREKYTALRDVIARGVKSALKGFGGKKTETKEEFWALKDVSFQVKRGEVVGIIGRNGAGKSTLLKILSRITEPTTGRVRLKGRVASLLEVGTGFHPELTGRENIYLNGAVLGMMRQEIDRKFDEIVAFAEVEKFLDTPVKRYSSGMYVRLAFAVAAHLEPEILVVDEVLAVGDAAFQKKCLGKMGDVASKEGRTVLFVSHDMAAVRQLTKKSLLLYQGQIDSLGETEYVIDKYLISSLDYSTTVYDVANIHRSHSNLSMRVKFLTLEIENYYTKQIPANSNINLKIKVICNQSVNTFRFSMTIYAASGIPVGSLFTSEKYSLQTGELATFIVILENLSLSPGIYYLGIATGKGNHLTGHSDFDIVNNVLHFEIIPPEGIDGTKSYWYSGWGNIRFREPLLKRVA
jgi:lipopolysaccharide transport system ATP-binding protein